MPMTRIAAEVKDAYKELEVGLSRGRTERTKSMEDIVLCEICDSWSMDMQAFAAVLLAAKSVCCIFFLWGSAPVFKFVSTPRYRADSSIISPFLSGEGRSVVKSAQRRIPSEASVMALMVRLW